MLSQCLIYWWPQISLLSSRPKNSHCLKDIAHHICSLNHTTLPLFPNTINFWLLSQARNLGVKSFLLFISHIQMIDSSVYLTSQTSFYCDSHHKTGLLIQALIASHSHYCRGPLIDLPTSGFIYFQVYLKHGLPLWLSGKESACQCRKCEFDLCFGKIPWRRKKATNSNILAWEAHGQMRLAGYSPWGHKRVGHDLATKQQKQSFN